MRVDDLATAAAAAIAVAMLVVTAVVQHHGSRFGRWLKARDAFALIPAWTFFAPNPGTSDTRLLWRQQYGGGATSPWHEAFPPRSSLVRGLWNPEKRIRKAITDVGPMVARRAFDAPDDRRL